MSRIALEGNVSGTGVFTLASPNGNTNRTLTLPDEAGTVLTSVSSLPAANLTGSLPAIDGSNLTGVLSYTDTDALDLFNATGSAPVYACRAWVNFNGTGTVAIRGSGNVSSITDHGTGDYTVNFTTAMPDADYGVGGTQRAQLGSGQTGIALRGTTTPTSTGGVRIQTPNVGSGLVDSDWVTVHVFR